MKKRTGQVKAKDPSNREIVGTAVGKKTLDQTVSCIGHCQPGNPRVPHAAVRLHMVRAMSLQSVSEGVQRTVANCEANEFRALICTSLADVSIIVARGAREVGFMVTGAARVAVFSSICTTMVTSSYTSGKDASVTLLSENKCIR